MSIHEDTLQGLHEALEYVKGDTTKGRSITLEIEDDEIDADQLIIRKIEKLSREDKQKVSKYADELLLASSV